jgi:hypothetical protein
MYGGETSSVLVECISDGGGFNLGKFGFVSVGRQLLLSPEEANGVIGDARFSTVQVNTVARDIEIEVQPDLYGENPKKEIRCPFDLTLKSMSALLQGEKAFGGDITIDLKIGGNSILGTNKLKILQDQRTSDSSPAVDIENPFIAEGTIVTVEVSYLPSPAIFPGGGAEGLRVWLRGSSTDAHIRIKESAYASAGTIEQRGDVIVTGQNFELP